MDSAMVADELEVAMNLREVSDLLAARQLKPAGNGKTVSARCPAHEDSRASLSVTEGDGGKLLLYCHAGCTAESVCASLSITLADLFADKPRTGTSGRIIATYDYRDESGKLLFQVCRMEPKTFRQRRPVGSDWDWNVKGVRRVPFRLPELLAAVEARKPVFIVEGEKDALAVVDAGFAATCNPGGANKWPADFAAHFKGAEVIIIADKDEPGRKHAQNVAAAIHGTAASVRVIEMPDVDGRPVKDASDFFACGRGGAELDEFAQSALLWSGAAPAPPDKPDKPRGKLPQVRPWIVINPDAAAVADAILVGPGNWLTRGSGLLLVAPTGSGKSTLDATLAFSFALGCEAVGLRPSRALKSLVIQAEDDDLDLAEMKRGIVADLAPSEAERETLRSNVLEATERAKTGAAFVAIVAELLELHRPDLLHLNPLSAYFGDDLKDQKAVAAFFRNSLNPLLSQHRCALVCVHHTNKPSKERDGWRDGEQAYAGSGSADLANWAREVLTLRQVAPGLYELAATKRWRKLGWTDADGKPSGTRLIAHARDGLQVWRDATRDTLEALGATPYTVAGLCALVPDAGIDKANLVRAVGDTFAVSARTAASYVADGARLRRHTVNGQAVRCALFAETRKPRREVYPEQPANRPVVWVTLTLEGSGLCKRL